MEYEAESWVMSKTIIIPKLPKEILEFNYFSLNFVDFIRIQGRKKSKGGF